MIFKFGGQLQPVEIEEWEAERSPAVFVTDARHAEETLARAGIIYENEIRLEKIGFCKIENQQECVAGTLCIPKLLDVLNSRYRMFFFVNRYHIVIVDDEDFSLRLIRRIQRKRMHQGETKEQFLYNFIAEFMSRDQEMLVAYERRLLRMEEDVTQEHTETFQNRLMPIRRELLNLRSYYDEMMDLTKELTVRADTLAMGTPHEIEYTLQFNTTSIASKSTLPQEGAKRVLMMAAVIIIGRGILNHIVNERRKRDYTGKRRI